MTQTFTLYDFSFLMDSSAGGWETMQLGGLCPDRTVSLDVWLTQTQREKGYLVWFPRLVSLLRCSLCFKTGTFLGRLGLIPLSEETQQWCKILLHQLEQYRVATWRVEWETHGINTLLHEKGGEKIMLAWGKRNLWGQVAWFPWNWICGSLGAL